MKIIILTFVITLSLFAVHAQVAINTTGAVPDPSAILDLQSTDKGFLVPRVTTTERNAISTSQSGLLVYDQTTNSFWYYDNSLTSWVEIVKDGSQSINDLTDSKTDNSSVFIGLNSGTNDNGNNINTAVGISSLNANTSGTYNTALGNEALMLNTSGYSNTALGKGSLSENTEGHNNTAVGVQAMRKNTTGEYNTIVGFRALDKNTTGNNNTAFGFNSLFSNTTASSIVAIGIKALYSNTEKSNLVAVGDSAMFNNGTGAIGIESTKNTAVGSKSMFANTTGYFNSSFGFEALYSCTSGNYNAAFGNESQHDLTTGEYNTSVGSYSLQNNTTGSNNVAVGKSSSRHGTDLSENVAIGSAALYWTTSGSMNTVIGYQAGFGRNGVSQSGNIFIGYEAGYNELGSNKLYIENSNSSTPLIGGDFSTNQVDINGSIKITGGNPGNGKVLTSDADGIATWETPETYATELNDLSDVIKQGTKLFMGTNAGINNAGTYNTGIGYESMTLNTSGTLNTALGYKSLDENTTGSRNSTFGHGSMGENISGNYNTAFGYNALASNTSGNGNTAFGYNAYTSGTYSNSTAIGYNASVNGNNQVHIGNTSVTEIKGQVAFTTYSDGRIKENIKEDVVGLDFIMKLRPVTYTINLDKENQILGLEHQDDLPGKYDIERKRQTGFIAQEVDSAAEKTGFNFSAIDRPEHDNDLYGLSYAAFVVPLVKGMQEQQKEIKDLRTQNNELKQRLAEIEKILLKITQ